MQEKGVMTAKEAAEYLGLSLPTLYRYIWQDKIPCFRLGNRWRFQREILDQWIHERIMVGPNKSDG